MLELPSQTYLPGKCFPFCVSVSSCGLVLPVRVTVTHSGGRKQSVSGQPLLWHYPANIQCRWQKQTPFIPRSFKLQQFFDRKNNLRVVAWGVHDISPVDWTIVPAQI